MSQLNDSFKIPLGAGRSIVARGDKFAVVTSLGTQIGDELNLEGLNEMIHYNLGIMSMLVEFFRKNSISKYDGKEKSGG